MCVSVCMCVCACVCVCTCVCECARVFTQVCDVHIGNIFKEIFTSCHFIHMYISNTHKVIFLLSKLKVMEFRSNIKYFSNSFNSYCKLPSKISCIMSEANPSVTWKYSK